MERIGEYLQLELEKAKAEARKEFEAKKQALKEEWERKIAVAREEQKKEFEFKKQVVIKNAFYSAEKNFYHQLALKRAALRQYLGEEILSFLKEADSPIKEKINRLLINAFKKRISPGKEGFFRSAPSAFGLLKENFPQSKIEEDAKLVIGFYYFDEKVEIDATEQAIVKKYLEYES